jgi:hypothetical protein
MLGDLLVRASIQAALAAYFVALAMPVRYSRAARVLWTIGVVLVWLHIAVAMFHVHHGSHAAAVEETARRTDELFGVRFGGGVYFNYVFALLWTADAAWWWLARHSYEHRPRWLALLIHGYLLFIVINGAIVFASGVTRWASMAALVVVMVLIARRASEPERGTLVP